MYPVEIIILAADRPGLLSEVANTLADTKTNIVSAKVNAGKRKDGVAAFDMVLEIKDLDDLKRVIQRLHRIKDIMTIDRVFRDVGGRVIQPV